MKFSLLVVLAAPALVAAQGYGAPADSSSSSGSASATSAAPSSAPVPSAAPGQHFVTVSPGGNLTFDPSSITAAANETVTFLFPVSGGFQHSVTQSSFANPCTPLQGGFDSGLQPNNMQFTITITNATQPIWFYCKQILAGFHHCGLGMVGGINIPASSPNTVDKFIAAAKALGNNEPGQQTASSALTGVGAAATAPASSQTASAAGASKSPSSAGRLATGAGSVLAGLAAAFALA